MVSSFAFLIKPWCSVIGGLNQIDSVDQEKSSLLRILKEFKNDAFEIE